MLDRAVTDSIVESSDLGTVLDRGRVSGLPGPQRFAGSGGLSRQFWGSCDDC